MFNNEELRAIELAEFDRILSYVTDRYSIDWSMEDTRLYDWIEYLQAIEEEGDGEEETEPGPDAA